MSQLQRLQNTAARLITFTPKFDHLSPVLFKLHWLPVKYRIQYTTGLLTFKGIHFKMPQYLINLLFINWRKITSTLYSRHLMVWYLKILSICPSLGMDCQERMCVRMSSSLVCLSLCCNALMRRSAFCDLQEGFLTTHLPSVLPSSSLYKLNIVVAEFFNP